MNKKQLAFLVNVDLCIGCQTCVMACKNQYHQTEGVLWRKLYPINKPIYPHRDRAYYSLACNHCENPPCAKVCPVTAYTKREKDGIVVHDQNRCFGCGSCIKACPFGAPKRNEVLKKVEKCSLCYERIDDNKKPACVQGCPTGALSLIDLATFKDYQVVQYPPGFPNYKPAKPSTRFKLAKKPIFIGREV